MARAKARRKATTGRAKRTGRPAPPRRSTPEDRLIDAALELAARQGWHGIGLAQIAAEAGLPLYEAYALHRSKAAILGAFTRRVDRAALAAAPDAGDTPRERLFELLMRRFEELRPHRLALKHIVRERMGHPAALCGLLRLRRSLRWMLEAAGASPVGYAGALMVSGLSVVYLSALRVFLDDNSEDLGRTMATLDRSLRRAESAWNRLPRLRRPAASAA
ncbi:MAG: hypothetical protein ACREFQ_23370 [Stellaceae bacterium]